MNSIYVFSFRFGTHLVNLWCPACPVAPIRPTQCKPRWQSIRQGLLLSLSLSVIFVQAHLLHKQWILYADVEVCGPLQRPREVGRSQGERLHKHLSRHQQAETYDQDYNTTVVIQSHPLFNLSYTSQYQRPASHCFFGQWHSHAWEEWWQGQGYCKIDFRKTEQ